MKSKISIITLLLCVVVYPQNDYKVLSSDQNSIVIEYTPRYTDTSLVTIENQQFINIVLDFGDYPEPYSWGLPAIPERRMSLGVPVEFGNIIEVLSTQFTEIDGQIAPIPKLVKEGNLPANKYTIGKEYYNYEDNPQLVLFGDFGITRGLKNQSIRILPVKFNVQSRKIKLYKHIVFRVQYGKGGNVVANQKYDELLNSAFINYDVARHWQGIRKKTTINKVNTSSVLATGKWVKFEAPQEGIYKIDYEFLSSAGFDLNSIDPRTIKIYNNGGKVLSENVNDPRPVDLIENAIAIVGESDGKFDEGDYILFYGRGTDFWDYDPAKSKIVRFHHPYSNHNYYWITFGGINGKRIQNKPSLNTSADYLQTSSLAFADLEEDKINIGKTGRDYYGDNFTQATLSRTYTNSLNGRISSTPINYNVRFAVASKTGLTLRASENNVPIMTRSLNGYAGYDYRVGVVYDNLQAVYQGNLPDNRSVLKLSIDPFEINSVGYIDYFEISYTKDLEVFDNKILLFSKDTTAVIEYYLHNFPSSDISIYDVTDPANVKLIANCSISGGDCRFQVAESKGSVSKYIGVGNKDYLTPVNPVSANNSDLRGIQGGAKYIIISPKDFLEAANRLKEFRENQAVIPISTVVIQVDQIFDEFSCGMIDVSAIRDFIKYAYDNWQITPEYVLFFGKGTYDIKNTEGYNDNFVPCWQTKQSLIFYVFTGDDSYTSDDYYVNVDGNGGYIDLVPGRITAANLTQANDYVSKVIDYELNSENKVWKNSMTLVADDGLTTVGNDGNRHTFQMEYIANSVIPKSFSLNKIYLADYPTVLTSEGRRKPQVNVDIIDAINNGTVLVNYIGHGNPEVWTHEIVFEKSVSIPQLHNKDYFFLVAATCDFAYYDKPNEDSGTDELILKPDAGAIAGLSSVRVVESSANYDLNKAYMNSLLNSARDTLNLMKTIGSAYFTTKSILGFNSVNDKKFHLFGDPVLRLQVPRYAGTIDSVNGQTLTTDVQLRALSNTHISGTILTPDGKKNENFNGQGILTVFDSERIKKLEQIGNYSVVIPGGVIFRGGVSVINGEFTASFVVPKDISYENKYGKIIFYYFDNNSDGIAFTNRITVGGTDTTVVNDGTGPAIDIFFDNSSSYNTYLVGPSPNLIVKLSDETGLNTTGTGVGHKLEGILNENESAPIDFTNFFTGDLDASGKSGEINYTFDKLDEGEYSLLVKAWDVFNNYSNETTYFSVVTDDKLVVRDVYNYPNPFRSNTTFTFQHNLNEPVNVRIKIYTIAGRMIKEIESNDVTDRFVKINWDGRDGDGDVIANGTYLYKIIVNSQNDKFNQSVLGKMAVIR